MPGSELEWIGAFFSSDGGRGFMYAYSAGKFRYAAFLPNPGPAWRPADIDFRRDYQRLGMTEALYSAANPDLRQFKRNGGKLLMYQGWSDPYEPPAATAQYYETVERLMGGRAATQDFYRLFMIPGMGHCGGGDGAGSIDYLTYLERWVERGTAPQQLIGWHMKVSQNPPRFPPPPSETTFSRPVYPYPSRVRYDGSGDPNAATSFGPVGGK